jgi:hypothetical protein
MWCETAMVAEITRGYNMLDGVSSANSSVISAAFAIF